VNPLALHAAGAIDPIVIAERLGLEADPYQVEILLDPHPRELINVHRQGGKSSTCAICACSTAVYQRRSLTLIVAPAMRQSQELFKVVLTVMRAIGKPFADEENSLSLTLENGSRIVSVPSDSTTSRGFSAVDLMIFDKSQFVSDETYDALTPALAVSKGRILAAGTPAGKRGWWYRASQSKTWRVTTRPVTECGRIDKAWLEEWRADHGDAQYRSEWLCQFTDAYGQPFSTADIAAISGPGELGLIAPGALFLNPAGERPMPRVVEASARLVRSTRCAKSDRDGHHRYRDGLCLNCGELVAELN